MTETEQASTASLAEPALTLPRACATCGSSRSTPAMASRPAAEDSGFTVIRNCWTGFFQEKVFFTYHRCAGCGLLYAPRYLAPALVAELYSAMPANMTGVPVRLLEKTQRGYFDFFRRFAPDDEGDYLEVGPDTGRFTQFVARESRFGRHHLFEPNHEVLDELTLCMGGRPHQVHSSLLDFDAVPDGTVSGVTMIHVLDHLLEPLETLRNLRRKMTADGVIMAVIHDESSLLARLLGRRWPAYCIQHPQVYRPATMRAQFEQAGFRVLATQASTNYFPLGYLAQHLAYALGLGQVPALLPPAWSLPLKLGNFMIVATAGDNGV